MAKQKIKLKIIKRRLVNYWSPLFRLKKSSTSSRMKERQIGLGKGRVVSVKARRFKTSKSQRSKKFKQIIIPLYIIRTKELAICLKPVTQPKKTEKIYTIVVRLRPRKVLSYAMILSGLVGIVFFTYRVVRPPASQAALPITSFSLPTPKPETDFTKPPVMSRSEPQRIQISRIGVDTSISLVGRLADGSMETPNVLDNITGWYKYSPTPGELGPSIIVGHVDSYKGPSVFWRLRELMPGDKVIINRADGSVANFTVISLRQFDQSNFPTQEVYGNIDHAGIRLITCGGTFNQKTGHYTENTVVFGRLIDN